MSPQKIAAIVNERMRKPTTDASVKRTIFFFVFFLSHESDAQRFEFSPTLRTRRFNSSNWKLARNIIMNFIMLVYDDTN